MKRNFKPMAALAVCALGALAVSSCTKDEFFGLEDSVVIDASTKYEIAMSQEYADYARACFNIAESFNQEVDTTKMESFIAEDGKRVLYIEGASSQSNAYEALENLRKAFPELTKADAIDFDEIQKIALSNNEALKDIAAKASEKNTKYGTYSNNQARSWLASVWYEYYGYQYSPTYANFDGYTFNMYSDVMSAVHSVIYATEYTDYQLGGGLVWGDYSAVTISSYGEGWPSIDWLGGSPMPEADFLVVPPTVVNLSEINTWEIGSQLGGDYISSGRLHYIYNAEGQFLFFY